MRIWRDSHEELVRSVGVDMIKADFGEQVDGRSHRPQWGIRPHSAQRIFAYLYNKCVYEAAEKYAPKMARSCSAAHHGPAVSASLLNGAATRKPIGKVLPPACAAVFPGGSAAHRSTRRTLAGFTVTSATQNFTSAGCRPEFSQHTCVFMA